MTATGRRAQPRRRRAWLAAFLSFVTPGTGQLYNGEWRRAASLFAACAVIDVAFFFVFPLFHPDLTVLGAMAVMAIGVFSLQVLAAVQAFLHARRAAPVLLAPWQRGWMYAAMILALPLLNLAAPRWVASYRSPSASNVPTILADDQFLVELGSYRRHAPRRGEMIVFLSPIDGETVYVKRVVGLPGETVQLRAGQLYIDGRAVPRQQVEDYAYQSSGSTVTLHQFVETLPGGASYRIVKAGDDAPLDNTPPYEVPADHYFTLGDNRDNSLDSRVLSAMGYVPAANLIGRAYMIYWPLARLGLKLD